MHRSAIELEPRRVAAHLDRIRLLRRLGRTAEARRELATLRRLVDEDDPCAAGSTGWRRRWAGV